MSLPLYTRPYVEFDFTRMAFDTRVSFSRSSDGAYFDAAGVMQTASSNVPRKIHNPATGAVRGLLVEEQRTNLVLRSQEFGSSYWAKIASGTGTAPVVTANYATAPDGTMTASRVQMNKGAGATSSDYALLSSNNVATAAGIAVTHSVWIKSNTGDSYTVNTLRADGSAINLTVSPVFQRFGFTVVTINTSPVALRLLLRGTTGSSQTADISVWGAQFEVGSYPTSYIPTTTATVTRSADVATFTIPPRVVRLVTIYDDGTTSQQAVTPGASYTIPTGQKPILRIRGYFA